MKHTNDVSLGAVHTHTHKHTLGILVNKKIRNITNKIQKDSKNLVLIDDTGGVCYLFVCLKLKISTLILLKIIKMLK